MTKPRKSKEAKAETRRLAARRQRQRNRQRTSPPAHIIPLYTMPVTTTTTLKQYQRPSSIYPTIHKLSPGATLEVNSPNSRNFLSALNAHLTSRLLNALYTCRTLKHTQCIVHRLDQRTSLNPINDLSTQSKDLYTQRLEQLPDLPSLATALITLEAKGIIDRHIIKLLVKTWDWQQQNNRKPPEPIELTSEEKTTIAATNERLSSGITKKHQTAMTDPFAFITPGAKAPASVNDKGAGAKAPNEDKP